MYHTTQTSFSSADVTHGRCICGKIVKADKCSIQQHLYDDHDWFEICKKTPLDCVYVQGGVHGCKPSRSIVPRSMAGHILVHFQQAWKDSLPIAIAAQSCFNRGPLHYDYTGTLADATRQAHAQQPPVDQSHRHQYRQEDGYTLGYPSQTQSFSTAPSYRTADHYNLDGTLIDHHQPQGQSSSATSHRQPYRRTAHYNLDGTLINHRAAGN